MGWSKRLSGSKAPLPSSSDGRAAQAEALGPRAGAAARLLVAAAATLLLGGQPAAPAQDGSDRAAPAPLRSELTFRLADHRNEHSTMGFSTDSWLTSTVTVQPQPDRQVRVEERGERGDSSVGVAQGYRSEVDRWSTVWTGTWTPGAGDQTGLVLELAGDTCARTVTRAGDAEETTPCPPVKTPVRLECRSTRLRLGPEHFTPDSARALHDVWDCRPDPGGAGAPRTPLPWVFGKDVCVEAAGRWEWQRTYRLCAPPGGSAAPQP